MCCHFFQTKHSYCSSQFLLYFLNVLINKINATFFTPTNPSDSVKKYANGIKKKRDRLEMRNMLFQKPENRQHVNNTKDVLQACLRVTLESNDTHESYIISWIKRNTPCTCNTKKRHSHLSSYFF